MGICEPAKRKESSKMNNISQTKVQLKKRQNGKKFKIEKPEITK